MRTVLATLLVVVTTLVVTARDAAASEPTGTVVVMECSASGPVAAACLAVSVVLHELAKGPDGFGPNGEVMKILRAHVEMARNNIQASRRENGELAKAVRALTGISLTDIEKYGIQGGPNSEFAKLSRMLGITSE